ncbi:MAG: AMP-binding protein [Formosimonas sp.]
MRAIQTLNRILSQPSLRTAITQKNANTDWATFLGQVSAWYTALSNRPEHRWALYIKDTEAFLAALLGAWCAGKILYLPSDALPSTQQALSTLVDGFIGDFSAADLTQVTPTAPQPLRVAPDLSCVFFTSGSTGQPKPIVKTIAQLMLEVETLQLQFGDLFSNKIVRASVSHQHFYGFIFRLLLPLIHEQTIDGDTIVYPENLLSLPKHPFILISSPAFLSRIAEHPDWPAMAAHLKGVFSAGGKLKTEHAQHVLHLWQQNPIEIYGSTETGAVAYRQDEPLFTPLPQVEVSVNAEHLLSVRSPYSDVSDAPQTTSDKVQLHPNGQFSLQGRADRLIKIEEKRISLTQIEQLLNNHDWVQVAHLVPLPSATRLILGAVIILSAEGQQQLARLGRRQLIDLLKLPLKNNIEALAIPKRWRFVDYIPVNLQGKMEFNTLSTILNTPAPITLPTVIHQDTHPLQATFELLMPVDLLYFQGHFAQEPILPGVAQIDWAQHFARLCFSEHISAQHAVLQIKQLKFQQIISPLMQVTLQLQYLAEKSSVQFSYSSADANHASGTLVWSLHD